jgi:hypothetical protein
MISLSDRSWPGTSRKRAERGVERTAQGVGERTAVLPRCGDFGIAYRKDRATKKNDIALALREGCPL